MKTKLFLSLLLCMLYAGVNAQTVHYKCIAKTYVYSGAGYNYSKVEYEEQGGLTFDSEYTKGSIVECNGSVKNGFMIVEECEHQNTGGRGSNGIGWVPVKNFVKATKCTTCAGKGHLNSMCPECEGNGFYMCECNGTGKKICPKCKGAAYY